MGDREAVEAPEMHRLGELLRQRHADTGMSRAVAGQVSQVLHMTANEIGAGRGVAVGVRRAVRGLAAAVGQELDARR